jgi:hypothetical protein
MGRGLIVQFSEDCRMGDAVIGGVYFHNLKMLFIEIEHFALVDARRIEGTNPILKGIAGSAEFDHL